jgi:hypothetical protein
MALACATSLSACGFGESQGSSSPTSTKAAAPRAPTKGQADMVAAVSAGREAGIVDLGFTLLKRPTVGEPFEIEFAITPAAELERLYARFQASDGLQIVSGGETEHMEHPPVGAPVGHRMTVMPKADGIFAITAVVLADSTKESVARTFSIPVIAGQGLEVASAGELAADSKPPATKP